MKEIVFDRRAKKEFNDFPKRVKLKFVIRLQLMSEKGFLPEPEAKKLYTNLYEIRVRLEGSWRLIYFYYKNKIIILSGFNKKTQKTPKKELEKAIKRKYEYE